MGEQRILWEILVEMPGELSLLGKSIRFRKDNIKIEFKERERSGLDSIRLS
jgi:hypothetical protein